MQRTLQDNGFAWTVGGIGALSLIVIIFLTPAGAFFSGDSGVKFLMLKGDGIHFTSNKPLWVQDIWEAGFFPIKSPFVYTFPTERVFAFPPAFAWLTKPIFQSVGFRGVLVLPAISLLLLWLACWRFLKKKVADGSTRNWLFLLLVLGSPLTIYGALFWEHATAVALAGSAIFYVAYPPETRYKAFFAGVIGAFSIWFRVEMIFFLFLVALATSYDWWIRRKKRQLFFLSGIAIVSLAFLGFNYSTYGSPLGAQSWQMMRGAETAALAPSKAIVFSHLYLRLIEYFPLILLLGYFWVLVVKGARFSPGSFQLLYIMTCFLFIVPLFLPNVGGKQMGPRYLLVAVPVMIVLMAMRAKTFQLSRNFRVLMTVITVYSIAINLIVPLVKLPLEYRQRIQPVLGRLQDTSNQVIIAQNQYIVQELAANFQNNHYFVAENEEELRRLKKLLQKRKITSAIYLDWAKPGEQATGAISVTLILLKPVLPAS